MNTQKLLDALAVPHKNNGKSKQRKLQCAECKTIHIGRAPMIQTQKPWTLTFCKSSSCQRDTVHFQVI